MEDSTSIIFLSFFLLGMTGLVVHEIVFAVFCFRNFHNEERFWRWDSYYHYRKLRPAWMRRLSFWSVIFTFGLFWILLHFETFKMMRQ